MLSVGDWALPRDSEADLSILAVPARRLSNPKHYFRASAHRFMLKLVKLLRVNGPKSQLNALPKILVAKFHNGLIARPSLPILPVKT